MPPLPSPPHAAPPASDANSELWDGVKLMFGLVAAMWVLETVDVLLLDQSLNAWGIHPRSREGLIGILAAPFLHGGFDHLTANSVPFLVLGFLVYTRGFGYFVGASLIVTAVAGLGTWLVGASNSVHIGASGLVFGYLGVNLAAGFFERSLGGVIVAVAVGAVYGGVLWGVLPGQPGVSWEGHLFGFLGGVLAARTLARAKRAA